MTITTRQFTCEEFSPSFSSGENVRWEYRDSLGRLLSGIAFNVQAAKSEAEKQSGEKIEL